MNVVIAGVGNLFFGDDGFGVEVARQLAPSPPPHSKVMDMGIRAIHLAYELLAPIDLFVVADCASRGGPPGTLYMIAPDTAGDQGTVADAHGMSLPVVFAAVRELGGRLPETIVIGCEPATIGPGIGLSPAVAAAVPGAIEMIRGLIHSREELR